MACINIAKGLKSTFKNARGYTVDQALAELEKFTDNYEVLGEVNRVYGDIDGKDIVGSQAEFEALDMKTKECIEAFLGSDKYALLTASSYLHRKISWRFVYLDRITTIAENKQWVKLHLDKIKLPDGITFDTIPYGKNQKMRMMNSNKDGETRPLKLVKGNPIDTLISYIPEGCVKVDIPIEKKKAPAKVKIEDRLSPTLLDRLVMNIPNDENTPWDKWYKVAQAIFNEGGSEKLFLKWSALSPKHNADSAVKQWNSLKVVEGTKLTVGSLWHWSSVNKEEHEKIILECCSPDDYQYQKIHFEKNHFKLMNPPCYVREHDGQLQFIKDKDFTLMYQNQYCTDGVFIFKWKTDPTIRTYEKILFKPKQDVPKDCFNIFTGFKCEAVKGNTEIMDELMLMLAGNDKDVKEYLENYFAHMIQKPYEKPGVALLFYTEKQGAGKDTPLDFIGKMLGTEYFYNTEDAENQVFGRFTSHLQKTILLKMEEVEFDTNKRNESALLSLITAPIKSYEAKGREAVLLDDYKRIVMTTNKSTPINVPESDRRLVLINSSENRVGDRDFWDYTYARLAEPETTKAYYHFLLNKDISEFNIRERPITNFYKDVKTTLRPYHAVFFQNWISQFGDNAQPAEKTASQWLALMNDGSKFPISNMKFGLDMKKYPDNSLVKVKHSYHNTYTVYPEHMHKFLVSKGWWVDT